jgi:hypothetical protein
MDVTTVAEPLSPLVRLGGGENRDEIRAFGGFGALIRFAAVFTLFSLITAVFFWPVIAHLHSALIGPPEDNLNDFWDTWYAAVAGDRAHFFSTKLLRFPEGTSLIYQSFAYPQVFAAVGLSRFFGTERDTLVALQNLTILASFPLAGTGAFYLVRHLVRSTAGGLVGGYVFVFNPSHVAHALHHAGVSSIEFLPFFALAWLIALERRNFAWLGAAVLFLALSALSCWYYLFYGFYFIGFQLLYQRIRDGRWPRGWPLLAGALCALCTLAVLSPLLLPMITATHSSVYKGGGNAFVADLAAYVAFPPQHLLSAVSRALYARFTGYPWEATVYLGLVNCALILWAFLRTGMARQSLNLYVLLGMIFFCVLASGETLHIAGMITPLHLPDIVLDKLPFFANLRTPSRAIVFVYLFLGIGTGFAMATILQDRRAASGICAAVLAVLIVADFYPAKLEMTPVDCPRGLSVLSSDPERGFGVLNLPIGYVEENTYMLQQTCHGRPMVGGVTTREMSVTLANRLFGMSAAALRDALREARVKYIILHTPKDGLYRWNDSLPSQAQLLRVFPGVYGSADMRILRTY